MSHTCDLDLFESDFSYSISENAEAEWPAVEISDEEQSPESCVELIEFLFKLRLFMFYYILHTYILHITYICM